MERALKRRVALVAVCALARVWAAAGEGTLAGLELREVVDGRLAPTGTAVPRDAVRVFVHESRPWSMRAAERLIAVDYGRSGVLFDRESGKPVRRFTVADGWGRTHPEAFGEHRYPDEPLLVGPGVYGGRRDPAGPVAVASARFEGRVWRACQPRGFLDEVTGNGRPGKRRERLGSWSRILQALNPLCYVEAAEGQGAARRFTMADGLASNIVTHLAVAGGALWAACVDIFDPEREEWAEGGLCRFDPAAARWRRIEEIAGQPVRWVTALQAVGGELWVGFRKGGALAGDQVSYGMGIYPGDYRPVTKAIVVARLAGGKWTRYERSPLPDAPRRGSPRPGEDDSSTEKPTAMAMAGDRLMLFSQTRSRRLSGNWRVQQDGHVSSLDPASGRWGAFDLLKDFDADVLLDLAAESGEVLVASNRGAHRWDAASGAWRLLDPGCTLRNPSLGAVTPVGDELWVGYTNQSFGVIGPQGISRYSEKTGQWTHLLPKEVGTSCPVRRIVATASGDVWVVFKRRENRSAAMEFPYYDREDWWAPDGVGCFIGGKWTFPVTLEGVPDSVARKIREPGAKGGRPYVEPSRVQDLTAVGDRLFVAATSGVYAGPGDWKRIVEHPATHVRGSRDGRELLIACQVRGYTHLALYGLRTGVLTVKGEPGRRDGFWALDGRGGQLSEDAGAGRWCFEWVRIPALGPGIWVVGPFPKWAIHECIATFKAFWIASEGELIRLDRARLGK